MSSCFVSWSKVGEGMTINVFLSYGEIELQNEFDAKVV